VAPTAWLRLAFADDVAPEALETFELRCQGEPVDFSVAPIEPGVLVVDPSGQLPGAAACVLSWSGPRGPVHVSFSTAAPGAKVWAFYDRSDLRRTTPFPDDFWLVRDPTTATGNRVQMQVAGLPEFEGKLFAALLADANRLDGWSPIAPWAIELSEAPDPSSLPQTPADSLDPLASVGLFALTGQRRGRRVPFRLEVREDTTPAGITSHTLLLFPSTSLSPQGRYGLVLTRRVLAPGGRPLEPSDFFARVLEAARPGEPAEVARVRELVEPLLDVVAQDAVPSILGEDVALAVTFSSRSLRELPADLGTMKRQVLAAPPPPVEIVHVEPDPTGDPSVAAIVTGTWEAPEWRREANLARDEEGRPLRVGARRIPFVLALPSAARHAPAPITMYQHGNPGSAEVEVPAVARRFLAEAGFATIGFTDTLNRETTRGSEDPERTLLNQILAVFVGLLTNRTLPDYWVQTNGEQLAFLRAIEGLADLDVLPLGAPDGVSELDVEAPLTYLGVSEGANHAPPFLVQAPEGRAAALVAGGARRAEVFVHQQGEAFVREFGGLYRALSPADIWVGVSLFQAISDRQDGHNHARFLYREPLTVLGTRRKASILLIEGLEDRLIPNHATESMAWALGPLPHLEPVQRAVPFLEPRRAPVSGNMDAETTAGFYQYTPLGVPGVEPTPGCALLSPVNATEGHFCVQSAEESLRQLRVFFDTALTQEAPILIDPLSP
jgi:hypothetical protein